MMTISLGRLLFSLQGHSLQNMTAGINIELLNILAPTERGLLQESNCMWASPDVKQLAVG